MTQDDSKLVRLSNAVLDRLEKERTRWLIARDKGLERPTGYHDGPVSVDQLVSWLLEQQDAHRQRAARQRERRRAARVVAVVKE